MKNIECDVEAVLKIIRGRWRVLILRELSTGTRRHAQLKRALTQVSQKILTHCLRDMERAGLIARKAYDSARPKVEYSLTPLGRELMRVIMSLHRWAEKHREKLSKASDPSNLI